ncbi:hypothetical protein ABZ837_14730 [Streptomyces sp. NPDC047197]|uniref:hypothetical protein n=1 Tax=Streptomyces sp. NPDC047197 TaxID=3155477 RepID=UPI0033E565DC
MKIDNILLAEGVTGDIRGAMTLVGYNQRVVKVPSLPFSFKQVLVVSLRGEVENSSPAQLSVNLVPPEGGSAFAFTQQVQLPTPTAKDVPSFTNIAMDIPFAGISYGLYEIKVSWREVGQDPQDRGMDIFVLDPAPEPPQVS